MTIIAIDQVNIGVNRRPLKEAKVAELMQSIKTNGLLNPITLDQNLTLIAGLHRLTACKLLGLTEIECHVISYTNEEHARLAQIDENLIRNELEVLERAELWLERDQILERMGLRARSGDNQYTRRTPSIPSISGSKAEGSATGRSEASGGESVSPPSLTTLELAREAGHTDRTFQQGKQIARDIAPQVKEVIRGTPAAKSSRTLLKIARVGGEERKRAEEAEQAARLARNQHLEAEANQQARIAAEARAKQAELQLLALQSVAAEREAKLTTKTMQQQEWVQTETFAEEVQVGDTWLLERHLIYCSDSVSPVWRDNLPVKAALAIAPLYSPIWNHDYLADQAQIVAVICSEGTICSFCSHHDMPFRFELLIGEFYVALFSHQPLLRPETPTGLAGMEGIVTYLINLYTKPSHVVINPSLGDAEVLIACERTGRICFANDPQPSRVKRAITRWQGYTDKAAEKKIQLSNLIALAYS
jgi:ParB family chromosome partitioning protein